MLRCRLSASSELSAPRELARKVLCFLLFSIVIVKMVSSESRPRISC